MFTIVHLHLLLNHLPIIITGIAFVLVAVALWRNDDYLARLALVFLIAGGLSALPTYLTGEGAERAVRNLPDVSKPIIEKHQDMALVAALMVGVLALFAIWALWRHRRPAPLPAAIVRLAFVGSLIGSGIMAYTGYLGGQIRHSEVRPGFVPPPRGPAAAGDSVR